MGFREFFHLPQENYGDKADKIKNYQFSPPQVEKLEEAIAHITSPERGAMTQIEKSKLLATFFIDDLETKNFLSLKERYDSWSLDKEIFKQALTLAVVKLDEATQKSILGDLKFKKLLKIVAIDERILHFTVGMKKNLSEA
ncbi:MAG TPA: hypothetical protein PK720_03830 [bacterium]|nr:hypothetical protein [bacterium]